MGGLIFDIKVAITSIIGGSIYSLQP